MKEIKPVIRKLNMKSSGGQVIEMIYKSKKGSISRNDIKKISNRLSKDLRNKKIRGYMFTNIYYDDANKWARAKKTNIGDKVRLYGDEGTNVSGDYIDIEDPEEYSEFRIVIMKMKSKGGSTDSKNDCLYNCLKNVIPPKDFYWKCASHFKNYLGVDREDPIDIDKLELVQAKLPKYCLSCTGDNIWTSSNSKTRRIKLKLIDGHYSIDQNERRSVTYQWKKNERIPVSCIFHLSHDNVIYYHEDLEEPTIIDSKGFYEMRKNTRDTHIYINSNCKKKDLIKMHTEWMKNANKMRDQSKGLINLYKTESISNTALNLFYKHASTIETNAIEQDEAEWIDDAHKSPVICCEKGYNGKGYKYDIVSSYPSIMKSKYMLFPVKRGEFVSMTSSDFDSIKFYKYGIYICNVEEGELNTKFVDKLIQSKIKLTHFDIYLLKELGCKVSICDTGKRPNALIYERDKLLTGSQIFGSFVDTMYDLKKKSIAGSKNVLNCLWGALCEKRMKKIIFSDLQKAEMPSDTTPIDIGPLEGNTYIARYINNDRYFGSDFARLKPFLLAKGRDKIIKIMQPFNKYIQRVHTDGFISSIKLDIKLGDDIGDLRYEGKCDNVEIVNNIKIIGNFE